VYAMLADPTFQSKRAQAGTPENAEATVTPGPGDGVTIDVTRRSIEETAATVLQLMEAWHNRRTKVADPPPAPPVLSTVKYIAAKKTVLVTGDSMSMPLDAEVARRLAGGSIRTLRDPHVGTGLSITGIVDWGKLSVNQVKNKKPDAIVVFIGANEGFPLKYAGRQVNCCGPAWAAAYATRARTLMNTYRQGGVARVYWLLLPGPRDPDRQKISKAVNLADTVAAQPYRAQVRLLDMSAIFTPDFRYRDAMSVGGQDTIVRRPDGIHLNDAGSAIAADEVLKALRADYGDQVGGAG